MVEPPIKFIDAIPEKNPIIETWSPNPEKFPINKKNITPRENTGALIAPPEKIAELDNLVIPPIITPSIPSIGSIFSSLKQSISNSFKRLFSTKKVAKPIIQEVATISTRIASPEETKLIKKITRLNERIPQMTNKSRKQKEAIAKLKEMRKELRTMQNQN